jgi:hypothetical protein
MSASNFSNADTLVFKCSFEGVISQDITYVIDSETKAVTIVGAFDTHHGLMASYNKGFFFVIEPNAAASVVTVLYFAVGETPVGIRSTLGLVNEQQYQSLPAEVRLATERLRFMAFDNKGRCPIQR